MKRLLAAALLLLASPVPTRSVWADMYQDASNAKLPEARLNILPTPTVGQCLVGNGTDWVQGACGTGAGGQLRSIVPQNYGAVGDGVADDTAAIQAWLTALKTGNYMGYCQGKFRLTASVNASPTVPYRVMGAGTARETNMAGCQFYIDYNSNWQGRAIDFTNPIEPTTHLAGADWSSIYIGYNPALTSPPQAFGGDYLTDHLFRDVTVVQFTAQRGTCVAFHEPWNIRQFTNVNLWGCGGHYANKVVPAGVTFGIATAGTTLTSSTGFFAAADVGRRISCRGAVFDEAWTITGYTSPTQVTVGRPASWEHVGVRCAMNGITGTIAAGSSSLTISAARMTANDVGRVVFIPAAGVVTYEGGVDALRTKITAVSGTTVTLANPAVTAASNVPVIISPAMEITLANDIVLNELSLEMNSGTQLVIQNSVMARFTATKLHAHNNYDTGVIFGASDLNETDFNLAILGLSTPMFDSTDNEGFPTSGLGRILISGSAHGLVFGHQTGVLHTGLPIYALLKNSYHCGFAFGSYISNQRIDDVWATPKTLIYNDGSCYNGALTFGPVLSYLNQPITSQYLYDAVHTGTRIMTAPMSMTITDMVPVPGLKVPLAGLRSYTCQGHLQVVADATRGLKLGVYPDRGLTLGTLKLAGLFWNGATPVGQARTTTFGGTFGATAAITDVYLWGTITTGGVPGDLFFGAAQNAVGGGVPPATVIEAGSDFACTRID